MPRLLATFADTALSNSAFCSNFETVGDTVSWEGHGGAYCALVPSYSCTDSFIAPNFFVQDEECLKISLQSTE